MKIALKRDLLAAAGCLAVLICAGAVIAQETVNPSLSGKELVAQRCTVCHSTARIERAQQQENRAWWEGTVGLMISKGAQLTAEERAAVVDYLSGGSK